MKGAELVRIVAGGPVGLLCARLLGRQGISLRLSDENSNPRADPRAATTRPATLDLLGTLGSGRARRPARTIAVPKPTFRITELRPYLNDRRRNV